MINMIINNGLCHLVFFGIYEKLLSPNNKIFTFHTQTNYKQTAFRLLFLKISAQKLRILSLTFRNSDLSTTTVTQVPKTKLFKNIDTL